MFITENSGFGSFNITTENQMFWNYTQPVLVINQNWQQSLCIHCPYIQYKKLTKKLLFAFSPLHIKYTTNICLMVKEIVHLPFPKKVKTDCK